MKVLFERRYRGFRVVNFLAVGVLLCLAVGVYLAKTAAGREAAAITRVDREIAAERTKIRMLKAEVASLERPDRIGKLSTDYLGLAPIDAKHEATADRLPELGGKPSQPAVASTTP
jgi:cell division protein FtsL